jgi:hypothetical protein
MEFVLRHFGTFQDSFSLGRPSKKAKAKANTLGTELVKKQKVDEKTNAETWKQSKKRHKMNSWWDYISHGIDVSKELNADFNCPKTHLMTHSVEQIW